MFSPARLMTTSAAATSSDQAPCDLRVPLHARGRRERATVARQHRDVVAARQEPLHERLAEKPGAAGDDDLHAAIYAIRKTKSPPAHAAGGDAVRFRRSRRFECVVRSFFRRFIEFRRTPAGKSFVRRSATIATGPRPAADRRRYLFVTRRRRSSRRCRCSSASPAAARSRRVPRPTPASARGSTPFAATPPAIATASGFVAFEPRPHRVEPVEQLRHQRVLKRRAEIGQRRGSPSTRMRVLARQPDRARLDAAVREVERLVAELRHRRTGSASDRPFPSRPCFSISGPPGYGSPMNFATLSKVSPIASSRVRLICRMSLPRTS